MLVFDRSAVLLCHFRVRFRGADFVPVTLLLAGTRCKLFAGPNPSHVSEGWLGLCSACSARRACLAGGREGRAAAPAATPLGPALAPCLLCMGKRPARGETTLQLAINDSYANTFTKWVKGKLDEGR